MRSYLNFLPFLLLLFIVPGCAFKKTQTGVTSLRADSPRTTKIEPEARSLFFQAERFFYAKDYDRAMRTYQMVKTRFPRGRAPALASYRIGSIYYYREDYPAASHEFDYFLSHFPQSELAFDVTYNLAAAEYQQEHYEKSYQVLARLKLADVQAQGPRRAEIIYQLAAQTASALGNHSGAVAAYAAEMQLPLSEATRKNVEENIDGHLASINEVKDLQKLQIEVTDPSTRDKISQRLLGLSGSMEVAKTAVEATPLPGSTALGSGTSGERFNIGILLPLTGRYAAYGHKALEGILLASKVYQDNRDVEFHLFIEDTKSNPTVAENETNTLFNEHQVSAIIGPLNWKESLAAGERAQQLGVLNLSLSAKEGISEKGGYLFQNALTAKVQMESLVQYCIQNKGFKRFAILAPSNNFGKDMANEFWEAVERMGGKIAAYETYAPEEKDFQTEIKNIAGLDPKFRRFESTKLADYLKEQKAKTGKEPKIKLQPIIDYDAIFIPDSPKVVAAIAANLAYFDVNGPALLGTTEWNNDQLYRRGGRYVEGAIFPGALNSNTKNPSQREFIRSFSDAYGTSPDLLAGQSYEAMQLIATAVQRSASAGRNELVNQLAAFKDLNTALGTLSFDNSRIAKRKLPVYTLESGGNVIEQ